MGLAVIAALRQFLPGQSWSEVRRLVQGRFVEINGTIAGMSASIARMAEAVTLMQHSARNIDQSVGPMMGTVNRFMPFSGGNSGPYQGPPPYSR